MNPNETSTGIPSSFSDLALKLKEVKTDSSSESSYGRTRGVAIVEAEKNGFVVVNTSPTTLLLDLDNKAQMLQYQMIFPMVAELFGARETDRWVSKSGRGVHVVINVSKPLSIESRIGLQACLGSDPKREILGFKRVADGIDDPSILFKPGTAVTPIDEKSPF